MLPFSDAELAAGSVTSDVGVLPLVAATSANTAGGVISELGEVPDSGLLPGLGLASVVGVFTGAVLVLVLSISDAAVIAGEVLLDSAGGELFALTGSGGG